MPAWGQPRRLSQLIQFSFLNAQHRRDGFLERVFAVSVNPNRAPSPIETKKSPAMLGFEVSFGFTF
jgi:hypothetical protein